MKINPAIEIHRLILKAGMIADFKSFAEWADFCEGLRLKTDPARPEETLSESISRLAGAGGGLVFVGPEKCEAVFGVDTLDLSFCDSADEAARLQKKRIRDAISESEKMTRKPLRLSIKEDPPGARLHKGKVTIEREDGLTIQFDGRVEDRRTPSHAGILSLIRDAKEARSVWADAALAEISVLTGIDYHFVQTVRFDYSRFEIARRA